MSEADRARLETHLRLAESLGASVVRLAGTSVAEALLTYSRKENVTRIVIGKPTHSRLRDRLRGSLLDDIVRGSGEIEVLVISGDAEEPRDEASHEIAAEKRPVGAWALSALLIAATTAIAAALNRLLGVPDVEMLYLLAVMIAAVWLGRGPSLLAAGLSVVAYDFFFVTPYLTLRVSDVRFLMTFAMMFGVGFLLSGLATRLRRQERDATAREERTAALVALSSELGSVVELSGAAERIARIAARTFQASAALLRRDASGRLEQLAAHPESLVLEANELAVSRWALEHARMAGAGTDTLPGARSLAVPLGAEREPLAVLALLREGAPPLGAEQRSFLQAFCRQAAIALERTVLAERASAAAVRARTEEMRSSLLAAVSHDLRTPLAGITGAATSLRNFTGLESGERAELVDTICDGAARLERLVSNLLSMTRLESGQVAPRKEWVPLEEIVGTALAALEQATSRRELRVDLAADLPLLHVDPILLEQLLVNLLENALRHAPEGPIELSARRQAGDVEVVVADRGPGLPPEVRARPFEKFVRGPAARGFGVGLGLAICHGIAAAHGGTIAAEARPGGGTTFRVRLPIGGVPPLEAPREGEPQ
jgi:two-component system sensor histidine kinase KdpD